VSCLEGKGPPDLEALVIACAAELLVISGKATDRSAAGRQAADCLASEEPRKRWEQMLQAQGAHLDALQSKLAAGDAAPAICEVKSIGNGFISKCNARVIGEVIRDLGGGRLSKESVINHTVGVDRILKIGDPVVPGTVLARVHGETASEAEAVCARVQAAFETSAEPPARPELILEVVDEQGPEMQSAG